MERGRFEKMPRALCPATGRLRGVAGHFFKKIFVMSDITFWHVIGHGYGAVDAYLTAPVDVVC